MKYEIMKGSEKDFEGESDDTLTVYRIIGSGNTYSSQYPSDKFAIGVDVIAERRPITEPVVNQQLTTEWDGEGLPPVGVECEITRGADWFPVTIKFISDYYTVILTRGGTEDSHQTSALQFRPVPTQTPENMARDEAIKALDYAIELADFCDTTYSSKIYDAIAAGKIPGVKLEAP